MGGFGTWAGFLARHHPAGGLRCDEEGQEEEGWREEEKVSGAAHAWRGRTQQCCLLQTQRACSHVHACLARARMVVRLDWLDWSFDRLREGRRRSGKFGK